MTLSAAVEIVDQGHHLLLVDEAAELEGPLGDAARAVKATTKLFERELERINFEVG